MKELNVKACGNGLLCKAVYDESDDTVEIFDRIGMALGYFEVADIITARDERWKDEN